MAYILGKSLTNQLPQREIAKKLASIITEVVVDAEDPGFANHSKAIGPFYSEHRTRELMPGKGQDVIEHSGWGYRKVVVSSPSFGDRLS